MNLTDCFPPDIRTPLVAMKWIPRNTALWADSEFKRYTFILNDYHLEKVISENEPLLHRTVSRRCHRHSSKKKNRTWGNKHANEK